MPHGKLLRIDPARHEQRQAAGTASRATNPFVRHAGRARRDLRLRPAQPAPLQLGRRLAARGCSSATSASTTSSRSTRCKAGDNFGWTEREGPFVVKDGDPTCSVYPLPADDAQFGYIYPVAAYDHDPPAGLPALPRHRRRRHRRLRLPRQRLPELRGKYVFGDDVNGRMFYAEASRDAAGQAARDDLRARCCWTRPASRSRCRSWPATPGSTCASARTTTASSTCCPRRTARSGRSPARAGWTIATRRSTRRRTQRTTQKP